MFPLPSRRSRAGAAVLSCALLLFLAGEARASVCVEGPTSSFADLSLTGGLSHSCALTTEGSAYCWGSDEYGQLGDGSGAPDDCSGTPCSLGPVEVDTSGIGGKAFVQMTSGRYFTCGLDGAGQAYCWGDDWYGQLGDGGGSSDTDVPVAVDTSGIAGKAFVQVSTGWFHACGLAGDGTAYCWGYDIYGQLGNGAGAPDLCSGLPCAQVPVAVDMGGMGGKHFVQLIAGFYHTCGLTGEGDVYCWGADTYGQIGDGGGSSNTDAPMPVDASVIGDKPFSRLWGGGNHNCGLTGDGMAYCWGSDEFGQLGDGTASIDDCSGTPCSQDPVTVDRSGIGNTPFKSMTAGGQHTCGLGGDGQAYCWGWDVYGQLGNDAGAPDLCAGDPCAQEPVAVDTVSTAGRALAGLSGALGNNTCALTGHGLTYCWGWDEMGQIGDGTGSPDTCGTEPCAQSPQPVDTASVTGSKTFVQLAAGSDHGCGLDEEGISYCWGNDGYGEIGDGGEFGDDSQSPVAVDTSGISGESAFVQVVNGSHYSCGLTADGVAYCWGRDHLGQLGDGGTSNNSILPVPVDTGPMGGVPFVSLAGGNGTACGLTVDGAAFCWGSDSSYQLGDGAGSPDDCDGYPCSQSPAQVDTTNIGGVPFVQLAPGFMHSCGLTADGKAYCWGSDGYGQLGNDLPLVSSTIPVAVDTSSIPGEKTFIQLVSGLYHSCGITSDGLAYCWGRDNGAGLGDGGGSTDSPIPVSVDTSPISGETTFFLLACSSETVCGITSEGVAYCWGEDGYGQLGNGTNPVDDCSGTPCSQEPEQVDTTPISGETIFVYLAAGFSHTCGLTSENVAYCWGLDSSGQLGDGGVSTDTVSPSAVGGCDDGIFCNGVDSCDGSGNCVPSGVDPCIAGFECNNVCNESAGHCFVAAGTPCTDTTPDDCQVAQCNGFGTCSQMFAFESEGTPCDDGQFCTETDACDAAGGCVGAGDPCAGGPECNDLCNDVEDNCLVPSGTGCDDSNLCTQTDTCDGVGTCVGSDPVVCTALDQCHDAGICNPGTGICTDPQKPDGNTCDDGDDCSTLDTCQGGVCTAGTSNKDTDGDTYVDSACPGGNDCDDNQIAVNPGASEGPPGDATCSDTWDNDCDALTDLDDILDCVDCTQDSDCDDGNVCTTNTCPAGVCVDTPVADGFPCDDSNGCTQTDECQAGVCTGSNPVTCTASDQCHDAGVCIPATGLCTDPAKADGTTCDDSDLCSGISTCQAGVCTGSDWVTCTASDQCHDVGTCNPGTGVCTDPAKTDGSPCDDSNACTQTDTCQGGVCTGSNPVVCSPLDQCHNAGTCNPGTGICSNPQKPNGSPCDDSNACTQTDTCQGGVCTGSNPVVCNPLDQCHDAGTCNPGTGICTNPPKADGTACDDVDMCTQTDTCQAGVCTGSNPVICTAQDQCHDAGTCDPGTGVCSNPQKSDGSPCDDGDPCSTNDVCDSGTCVTGATNKDTDGDGYLDGDCPGGDDCDDNEFAVNPGEIENKTEGSTCSDTWDNDCDNQTDMDDPDCRDCMVDGDCDDSNVCTDDTCAGGICHNDNVPDLDPCDDFDMCTQDDVCLAGVCTGTNPVTCTPLDQCHNAGTCDPGTGVCSDPAKPDGTACNDGQYCNVGEACVSGVCTGGTPRNCSAFDDQCNQGACDDVGDTCYADPVPKNGDPCDDSDLCTQTDTCQLGVCEGSDPVVCTPLTQCHNAGVCDPATGLCSNPPKADGTPCNDADACTQTDTCQSGACTGSDPVVCTPLDQCHDAGVCNPSTGICTDPPKTDGSACDNGEFCTVNDICTGGVCQAGIPRDCDSVADDCNDGVCDEVGDACIPQPKANGTPCDADGDPCTMNDACNGGTCVAGPPLDGDSDGYVSDLCGGNDCNDGDGGVNPGVFEGPVGSGVCGDGIDNDCDGLTDVADPQCSACVQDSDCDDGSVCTGIETCVAPNCVAGTPLDCDDSNVCTNDSCDPVSGCRYGYNTGPCDDGDFCTANDSCDGAGNCTVNTGSPCTTQCMENCNSTQSRCDPDPIGTACDDGLYCTENDACNGSGSCAGQPRDCSALTDQCHEGTCDETGNTCLADAAAKNGDPCDDGQYCTENETCNSGNCRGGTPRVCPDVDLCNAGICNDVSDACEPDPAPREGLPCDDDDDCTRTDTCVSGNCVGSNQRDCDDGRPCTIDDCDPVNGCFHTDAPDGTPCGVGGTCDDNNVYWTTTCQGGVCLPDQVVEDCDDGEACTDDICEDASGCSHVHNQAECEDGQYCTENDRCDQGECVSGPKKSCKNEAPPCYQGDCNELLRLCTWGEPEEEGTDCDDRDDCTGDGKCDGVGNCVIEGFCDELVLTTCDAPAVVYLPGDPGATDCRMPEGKVDMSVEAGPAPGGAGSFVPVRVRLSSTAAGGWAKELSELRVMLTLNPDDVAADAGKVAYVMGSALLQGGDLHAENDATIGGDRVMFRLFRHDELENPQLMPAPGGGLWRLDFVLVRSEDREGVFKLDVWAPCEAMHSEVGCHRGYASSDIRITETIGDVDLQRISRPKYMSTSGEIIDDPENPEIVGDLLKSPVLGCQCGTREGSGSAWALLLGFIWVVRRKVRV